MSNYKNNNSTPGAERDIAGTGVNGADKKAYESALRGGRVRSLITPEGRDVGGWDTYRRWLSRVQSPDKRRSATDPGLYTWKGYRNWSEKVRRDWKHEE